MAIERTEACPAVTVAATFNLMFSSGGSTVSVPASPAEQVEVVEGESTWVDPGQSFNAEAPDWELNVQMLEHNSGQTRGAIHTEPSELADTIMIGGTPVDILWQVTQDGNRVDLSEATFQIADSCVMFQPGVMLTFTDADGSQTVFGDTSPAFDQAQDLPLEMPVVFFDGVEFETSSPDGWTLAVNVVEHWNGRLYEVSHTNADDITAPVTTVGADDLAWKIQYTVDVVG